jgi:hypothetical protein
MLFDDPECEGDDMPLIDALSHEAALVALALIAVLGLLAVGLEMSTVLRRAKG